MSIASVLAYDIPAAPRGGYRALGYNPAVGATAEGVWGGGGAMNLTMGSGSVKVSSSSALDTSAGTGARTVRVFGIVAGVATSEDAILNGTTAVALTSAFTRIFRVRVLTVGTGGTNAGDLYVFTGAATAGVPDTATEVYAKALVGTAESHAAIFRVPTGLTGYVMTISGHGGDATDPVRIDFFIEENGVARSFASIASGWDKALLVPEPVPAGADVYATAICLGAGTPEVSACFEIVLR